MKEKLQQVRPHIALYRDSDTGLAWVEDGSAGIAYSPHPNTGGSGAAMKRRGAWDKNARTVRCRGFTYNIDQSVPMGDELDRLAATHCRCGGVHPPEATGMHTITINVPAGADRDSIVAYVEEVADQIDDGNVSGHWDQFTHWDSTLRAE